MSLTIFKTSLLALRKKSFLDCFFRKKSDRYFNKQSAVILDDFFFEAATLLNVKDFIECGANDAYASQVMHSKGINALAIEANPITFKNVTSKIDEKIKLINVGLGSDSGEIEFYVPKTNNTAGDATFNPRLNVEYDVMSITVKSLDDIIKSESIGKKATALWIDVEGFQKQVLAGASQFLNNQNCLLIKIEVENKAFFEGQILSEEVDTILHKCGFAPVMCDFEYGLQFNVVYVKKNYIDCLADIIQKSHYKISKNNITILEIMKIYGRSLKKRLPFITKF